MASNSISQEEARAALEQIDGIEQDARKPPTPTWVYAVFGTSLGVTVGGTIIGWTYWWVLFVLIFIASIAYAVWDNNRNVRPSMKQPIQEDPKTNWAAALAPALVMPLIWFVPEGSVVGGVIAGVVTAILFTAVMVYESKRR
ncbi:hypothetical protein [Corynebacterium ureicelerivorans]|uniref:Uncharacterized protein n=1 Tax=Corynebacterium ureicelerivorans TaxID=401472 RepID=A0A077HK48_9CORY|nr:hypothetical protein [Corynebacterium ureicelerivorans]AIL97413.1 hypothetical protein CUREI_09075 [Corynebacterium ureicelerivorans]